MYEPGHSGPVCRHGALLLPSCAMVGYPITGWMSSSFLSTLEMLSLEQEFPVKETNKQTKNIATEIRSSF